MLPLVNTGPSTRVYFRPSLFILNEFDLSLFCATPACQPLKGLKIVLFGCCGVRSPSFHSPDTNVVYPTFNAAGGTAVAQPFADLDPELLIGLLQSQSAAPSNKRHARKLHGKDERGPTDAVGHLYQHEGQSTSQYGWLGG